MSDLSSWIGLEEENDFPQISWMKPEVQNELLQIFVALLQSQNNEGSNGQEELIKHAILTADTYSLFTEEFKDEMLKAITRSVETIRRGDAKEIIRKTFSDSYQHIEMIKSSNTPFEDLTKEEEEDQTLYLREISAIIERIREGIRTTKIRLDLNMQIAIQRGDNNFNYLEPIAMLCKCNAEAAMSAYNSRIAMIKRLISNNEKNSRIKSLEEQMEKLERQSDLLEHQTFPDLLEYTAQFFAERNDMTQTNVRQQLEGLRQRHGSTMFHKIEGRWIITDRDMAIRIDRHLKLNKRNKGKKASK